MNGIHSPKQSAPGFPWRLPWLAKTLPQDTEAGGGLMVAVVQLAIALGATVGGLLFDGFGYCATFGASASVLMTAAGVALLAAVSSTAAARHAV